MRVWSLSLSPFAEEANEGARPRRLSAADRGRYFQIIKKTTVAAARAPARGRYSKMENNADVDEHLSACTQTQCAIFTSAGAAHEERERERHAPHVMAPRRGITERGAAGRTDALKNFAPAISSIRDSPGWLDGARLAYKCRILCRGHATYCISVPLSFPPRAAFCEPFIPHLLFVFARWGRDKLRRASLSYPPAQPMTLASRQVVSRKFLQSKLPGCFLCALLFSFSSRTRLKMITTATRCFVRGVSQVLGHASFGGQSPREIVAPDRRSGVSQVGLPDVLLTLRRTPKF